MGLGAPGAAPEGPKFGLFFKNFQILKKKSIIWAQGGGPWRKRVLKVELLFVVVRRPF